MAAANYVQFFQALVNSLLSLNRMAIHRRKGIRKNCCPFARHAQRLSIPNNDFCRSCEPKEEDETIFHVMCHYLTLLTELSYIKIVTITK